MDDWDRLRYIVSDPRTTLRANADALRSRLNEATNDFGETDALGAALTAIEQTLRDIED